MGKGQREGRTPSGWEGTRAHLASSSEIESTRDWQYEIVSEIRNAYADRLTSDRSVLLYLSCHRAKVVGFGGERQRKGASEVSSDHDGRAPAGSDLRSFEYASLSTGLALQGRPLERGDAEGGCCGRCRGRTLWGQRVPGRGGGRDGRARARRVCERREMSW